MATCSKPRSYPYPPQVVFDALIRVVPDTDFQVLWAARELGMISMITGPDEHRQNALYYTLCLRETADGHSMATIQATKRDPSSEFLADSRTPFTDPLIDSGDPFSEHMNILWNGAFNRLFDIIEQSVTKISPSNPPEVM